MTFGVAHLTIAICTPRVTARPVATWPRTGTFPAQLRPTFRRLLLLPDSFAIICKILLEKSLCFFSLFEQIVENVLSAQGHS